VGNKKLVFTIVVIVILLAGGVVFWYWSQKRAEVSKTSVEMPAETSAETQVKDGLGAKVFNKTNNPLFNKLPETNPFQVKTNPFK